MLIISDPCELTASHVYTPASVRFRLIKLSFGPCETMRSCPFPLARIGKPSLVQVKVIEDGFASAVRLTCNGSPSAPTASDDGAGWNFGGSV